MPLPSKALSTVGASANHQPQVHPNPSPTQHLVKRVKEADLLLLLLNHASSTLDTPGCINNFTFPRWELLHGVLCAGCHLAAVTGQFCHHVHFNAFAANYLKEVAGERGHEKCTWGFLGGICGAYLGGSIFKVNMFFHVKNQLREKTLPPKGFEIRPRQTSKLTTQVFWDREGGIFSKTLLSA